LLLKSSAITVAAMGRLLRWMIKAAPARVREGILRESVAVADDEARFRVGQPSMFGSLRNLARAGFTPGGIVDIGANVGAWSREAAAIFRGVPIHMIEGQAPLEPQLKATGFAYTLTLVGPESRTSAPFYLSGTGSSLLEEVTALDRQRIDLPVQRVDDLEGVRDLPSPLLLKLDVQGYELEVLAGATDTLARTEVLLSEVSLLEYNKGSPLMDQVIAWLAERDFLPYDICGGLRRSSDKALFQTDLIFVRRDSALRAKRKFWDWEAD
jgi:FkbM family methyltransferase